MQPCRHRLGGDDTSVSVECSGVHRQRRGGIMERIERPRVWSRRSLLQYGAGGLGALLVAACGGSPAASPAPAKPAERKPADAKPAESKPAAPAAAAQPAGGLTTANVTLQFMGHVAGGMNEQKAYDDILDEW